MTSTPIHAFDDDAIGDLDAVGIAEAIASGTVSSQEVAQAAIARAEKVNPALNAIQVADFERGLKEASSPGTGVFAGVPTFLKDNTDLAGMSTNHGSLAVNGRVCAHDAPFTQQLRSTGVVFLGKTTLPEFGFNATTEYATLAPTRNPWNTDYSSGASSGGSAALVAAGVVPIAHANDGGGSIRIPAAACGLVGLKPTRGRVVPAVEAASMPVDIISNGIVSRTVRDTAAFFAGAERFGAAAHLPAIGHVTGPSSRRLRVGLIMDSVTGTLTDNPTRRAVQEAATLLESLGHHVRPVALPVGRSFAAAFVHYWALLAFSTQNFGKKIMSPDFDKSKTDPLTRGLAKKFVRDFWRTPFALRELKKSEQAYRRAFARDGVDIVLSPVVGYATPKLGHLSPAAGFATMFPRLLDYAAFTPLNNAAGAPGLSLPLGRNDNGMPIGVHFSALHGNERTLLELAFELEEAQPFARIQG